MLAIATYVLAALILEIWSIDPSVSIVIIITKLIWIGLA